ncbi:kinase-like domain-containing protein [Trichophaea hybrida]|nr:kinase-like domain-containing protein [Trichophaea hybrida]
MADPLPPRTRLTTYYRRDIERWQINHQEVTWELGKQIGRGVSSRVFEGKYSQFSEVVAVKRIPKTTQGGAKEEELSFVREVQNFAMMSEFERFVKFKAWHEDHDFLYILMERIEYGSLGAYLLPCSSKDPTEHTQNTIKVVAKQLSEGLKAMHDNCITHRDLKPNNILVYSIDPVKIKIADFGVSKLIPQDSSTKLQTGNVGTVQYMAPEILVTSSKEGYSPAVDLWSLGCVLYWMVKGRPPFRDVQSALHHYTAYLANDSRPELGLNVRWNLEPAGVKTIQDLLRAKPSSRPTAGAVLEGNWLSEVE